MSDAGRFYERILRGLHKFEFTTYILRKLGEEHPGLAMAFVGAWSYLLNIILGNLVLTLAVVIVFASAAIFWRRRMISRRPKRRGRGRRRKRRSPKVPEVPPVDVAVVPERQR